MTTGISPVPRWKMAKAAIRENEQRSQFIVSEKAIVSAEGLAMLSHLAARGPAGAGRFRQGALRDQPGFLSISIAQVGR
jgi:hypothetical protein